MMLVFPQLELNFTFSPDSLTDVQQDQHLTISPFSSLRTRTRCDHQFDHRCHDSSITWFRFSYMISPSATPLLLSPHINLAPLTVITEKNKFVNSFFSLEAIGVRHAFYLHPARC
jgi:hypothetical protein